MFYLTNEIVPLYTNALEAIIRLIFALFKRNGCQTYCNILISFERKII